MTSRIDELLAAQDECLGIWQLRDEEQEPWTRKQVRGRVPAAGLRAVPGMDGVWTSVRGNLTDRQRRRAATLTAPDTALAFVSASRHWGFGDRSQNDDLFVVVARDGIRTGPKRFGDVLVCRTPDLEVTTHDGLAVTGASRTVADLARFLDDAAMRRMVLEALRLERVTHDDLLAEHARRPRRRGMRRFAQVLDDISGLDVAGTRSNAEAMALLRRRQAGRDDVAHNEKVAGFEADIVDHERREITEIDGPAFHVDPELDARKQQAWEDDGWTVGRRPSADAYDPDAEW